jgi:hypothetical protein
MNWAAISAVVSLVTLLFILVGGGAMWGTLTEKVSGLTKRADAQASEIETVTVRVNVHDVQIGKLQEWKDGYNAAARMGGHTQEVV